jgi:hypothetical protein
MDPVPGDDVMNNRMRRSVQMAPAGDNKSTDAPFIAETSQTTERKTAKLTSQEPVEASEVERWREKGQELSREYDTRAEADQKIVAAFREIREKPKAVKKAFRDALSFENYEKTKYSKVGEDQFLHEPETLQVFGTLTLSQQYELAKAPLDVKKSIREHFRTHPEDKPSKNTLMKMRRAAKAPPKPESGSGTKQDPEADTKQDPEAGSATKLDVKLVEIWAASSSSFGTMEESDRAAFLTWLDAAPKSLEVIRVFDQC